MEMKVIQNDLMCPLLRSRCFAWKGVWGLNLAVAEHAITGGDVTNSADGHPDEAVSPEHCATLANIAEFLRS